MKDKTDIPQGTLALMVLKALSVLGPLHGYNIARRIEQISGDKLSLNQGTLYPLLLKLQQEGAISAEWGISENNRKARFYKLTRAGRKQHLSSCSFCPDGKLSVGLDRRRGWPRHLRHQHKTHSTFRVRTHRRVRQCPDQLFALASDSAVCVRRFSPNRYHLRHRARLDGREG